MIDRDFTERDIHLALDGEMPAEERPAFERWLEANPEMKARWMRYEADRARLRETLAPILYERLPPALTGAAGHTRESLRNTVLWRSAAAAAIFAVGGVAGYGLAEWNPFATSSETEDIANRAIAAHVTYAAEKLHVVEVPAEQQDHLVRWLSNRVGTKVLAPDLSAAGYSLIGGRLLPAGKGRAAQLMYENAAGERVSLYIAHNPGKQKAGFEVHHEKEGCALYWMDKGYGYAVAGTSTEEELQTLASIAQQQFQTAGG